MPRFTSESSRALWEAHWERMWEQGRESELGPAGKQYILERHGREYDWQEPPYDDYNDYEYDSEFTSV